MPGITRALAEAPLALAVDVGSSSVRAMLFDRLGRDVEGTTARIAYDLRTTPDGGVEVDADELLDLTCRAVDGLVARLAEPVACVGVSCFWHSLVGVDAAGAPVTPVLTWADTRAAAAAERLRRRLDEEAVRERVGARLHPSYWPAKLAWLAEARPGAVARVARWMSFGEYLFLRLFGRAACSVSMASGTGLLDRRSLDWDAELVDVLGLDRARLPEPSDEPCSGLVEPFASRWPALARAAWRPAIGDGACSNVGAGCAGPGRIGLMVGTSGAMRVVRPAARVAAVPRGLWAYRLDARRAVVGGALSEGGGVFAWLARLLKVEPDARLDAELDAAAPDGHGLTILPFAAGERSPGWATDARASIVGMTLDTEPVDILRAALESVAYRFSLIAELLLDLAPDGAEIVASGGALLRSRAWARIMADVLGRPVRLSAEEEASSRGAAIMALVAIGAVDDPADLPAALGATFPPDAGRHDLYRIAADRQRALYDKLVAG